MEKRYFTSELNILWYPSYVLDGMTSTSAVMLCLPKSSISCVSAMPPMGEPERLSRLDIRLKAGTERGLSGAPTTVMLPSRRSSRRYELISCSAETPSRIKSKCFMISHLIDIWRNNHLVCSEAKRVFFFLRRSGKDYDIGSKRRANFTPI